MRPGTGEDRIEAPAQFAALTFQAALDDAVAASGADLEVGLRDTIPATEVPRSTVLAAAPVAAVESASVGEQVAYLLAHSENQVVEALAHTAAPAADLPATHEGATQLLTATAEDLGVDTAGMALVDSSGLSPDNRVSAGQLAGVVAGVARTPALGTVLEGLPRPGEDSTLGDRFPDAPARQAVAAKTGTLDQTVSSPAPSPRRPGGSSRSASSARICSGSWSPRARRSMRPSAPSPGSDPRSGACDLMEPMSDDHATDRPRAAADAEPGAPAEPGPAVAHPVDWAFAARTARSLAAAGPGSRRGRRRARQRACAPPRRPPCRTSTA